MEEIEEKIKALYEQGNSPSRISKKLKISLSEARTYLREMQSKGKIQVATTNKRIHSRARGKVQSKQEKIKEKIEQRRRKVKELLNCNKTREEIVHALGVSITTIRTDVKYLEEQSEIESKQEKEEKRRDKIAELYKEGKTQKEIAKILDMDMQLVGKDVKKLLKEGKIEDKLEVRRNQILNLYEAGKTQTEIAKELKIAKSTVSNNLKKLKEKGIYIKKPQRPKRNDNKEKIERKEKVKILYEAGKIQEEIAKELNVSQSTVSNDIKELKREGKLKKTEERLNEIRRLYAAGKTQTEIAKELGVSNTTISREIKKHQIVRKNNDFKSIEELETNNGKRK